MIARTVGVPQRWPVKTKACLKPTKESRFAADRAGLEEDEADRGPDPALDLEEPREGDLAVVPAVEAVRVPAVAVDRGARVVGAGRDLDRRDVD